MLIVTILIIFFTLIGLMALHEFGHFLVAKKFGVKVEEFGIGYPPRIFGKKIGETIYSINLLPFGAFVKIMGSDERVGHPRSFSEKPIWQRALILVGGVVTFWIIAFVLISFVAGTQGVPEAVPDDFTGNFREVRVEILGVAPDSPAEEAGIKLGDEIVKMRNAAYSLPVEDIKPVETVKEVQDFIADNLGREVIIILQRIDKTLEVSLVPRVSPPEGEGAIGISLVRVADIVYPWYKAPERGGWFVYRYTVNMPKILASALVRAIKGEKVEEVKFLGPIGIGQMMGKVMNRGVANFLIFVSAISVWLALFNLFPIPALDGGRLLFLAIEKARNKPVSEKLEQKITTTFFILLICFMVLVTIKDILRFF